MMVKCVIVYLARDIPPFVMYCVNGKPRSSLLIESTDSMIYIRLIGTVVRLREGVAQACPNNNNIVIFLSSLSSILYPTLHQYNQGYDSTLYVGLLLVYAAPPTQCKSFMDFSTNWLSEGSTATCTC